MKLRRVLQRESGYSKNGMAICIKRSVFIKKERSEQFLGLALGL